MAFLLLAFSSVKDRDTLSVLRMDKPIVSLGFALLFPTSDPNSGY